MDSVRWIRRVYKCQSKRTYRTWHAAEQVARRIRRNHDEIVGVYRCPICRDFHVGHSSERGR